MSESSSSVPPQPLSRRQRIALILGVGVAGAFIGPFGFMVLGTAQVPGMRLRAFNPEVLGKLATGVFTEGPLALFAACAFVGTLVFAPWFVNRLERLAATGDGRRKYYVRAMIAGIMLGFLAAIVTTALLMVSAVFAGAAADRPDNLTLPLVVMGALFFGAVGGFSMAVITFPIIVPLGAALGAGTAWVRKRIAPLSSP